MLLYTTLRHPITPITIFAHENASGGIDITSVLFGAHSSLNGRPAQRSRNPVLRRYASLISDFLSGKRKSLDAIPIDLSDRSEFTRTIMNAARRVPWGSAVSYARLAAMAGRPRAVRAAASVMRNNPFPLIVPCHRVIGSNGRIGGFMGTQHGAAISLKRRLLEREDVSISIGDRISSREHA
jgi:methylated-DNA-[protein]-cysteine S-methyltransferase